MADTGMDSSSGHSRPKFWKPGTDVPPSVISEERHGPEVEGSSSFVYNANVSLSIDQQRQHLPIFRYRLHLLYLLEKFQTVIVIGETGSGKSTQIPQYLLEAGWAAGGRVVAITQPRRVAAITVATRVADERGTKIGQDVGYAVRFEDCCDSARTRLKFLTDGLLVREMMSDPLLSKYSVVMLDEAHERSLNTDIVIGLLKKIQKKRPELRIIVASATLDAAKVYEFFNTNKDSDRSKDTVAALSVEGRTFPVDVFYAIDPVPDYIKATVETVMKIHHTEGNGDVLAFLTGMEEVGNVVRLLIEEARKLGTDGMKMKVLPMYGSLPGSEQLKVFERTPRNTRKIVVATNIAEASITINGIVYVVDCGFVKLCAYNPKCGVNSLVVVPISQASAEQRAGRAGRVRSGKVYRLYTEEVFQNLPNATVPEMQRSDMAPVIVQLKALGIDNILRFDFLSSPPAENVIRSLELLFALGALDENCHLTQPLGFKMAEFPLSPAFSKVLLTAEEFGCSEEAAVIAAITQIQNVFVIPPKQKADAERARRKFSVAEGDHITLLNVFRAFVASGNSSRWCKEHFLNYRGLCRANELRDQLVRMMKRAKVKIVSCGDDVDCLRRCLVVGLFANAARYHSSGVFKTIRDEFELHIHPTSVLYTESPPAYVLFTEVVNSTKDYMRDVTVIKSEWLYELAPHYYEFGTERQISEKRARLGV